MKKTSTIVMLILIGLSSAMISCTSKKTSLSDLEMKDSIYYLKGENKPYTGQIITKFSSGKDSLKMNIKDGKLDGAYITFHNNGKIMDSVIYYMGKVLFKQSFNKNGQKAACDCNEVQFNSDKGLWMTVNDNKMYDGDCISYWDNKNKKSACTFKKGVIRTEKGWYENGKRCFDIIYDENGNEKTKKEWNEKGVDMDVIRAEDDRQKEQICHPHKNQ